MTDMDKLITSIMKEAEKDGEPVTREHEAEKEGRQGTQG